MRLSAPNDLRDGGRRIVVFRTGYLGDTICAVPAFRLIAANFPDSELLLLTESQSNGKVFSGDVASRLGIFSSVHTYQPGRFFRAIRSLKAALSKCRPDLIITLPQWAETKRRVAVKTQMLRWLGRCEVWGQACAPRINGEHLPEPDRMIALLKQYGLKGEKPAYNFAVDPDAAESVRNYLEKLGVDWRKPFIAFCAGGKTAAQQWSLDSYGPVLHELHRRFGLPLVGLGSPTEQERYSALAGIPGFVRCQHVLTLAEMIELLRMAGCYFGNDTGPMHASAAVGTPVAVVMSARNPKGCWNPDVPQRLVFRKDVACEGCLLRECTDMGHQCMTGITPEHVTERLVPFLQSVLHRR